MAGFLRECERKCVVDSYEVEIVRAPGAPGASSHIGPAPRGTNSNSTSSTGRGRVGGHGGSAGGIIVGSGGSSSSSFSSSPPSGSSSWGVLDQSVIEFEAPSSPGYAPYGGYSNNYRVAGTAGGLMLSACSSLCFPSRGGYNGNNSSGLARIDIGGGVGGSSSSSSGPGGSGGLRGNSKSSSGGGGEGYDGTSRNGNDMSRKNDSVNMAGHGPGGIGGTRGSGTRGGASTLGVARQASGRYSAAAVDNPLNMSRFVDGDSYQQPARLDTTISALPREVQAMLSRF